MLGVAVAILLFNLKKAILLFLYWNNMNIFFENYFATAKMINYFCFRIQNELRLKLKLIAIFFSLFNKKKKSFNIFL